MCEYLSAQLLVRPVEAKCPTDSTPGRTSVPFHERSSDPGVPSVPFHELHLLKKINVCPVPRTSMKDNMLLDPVMRASGRHACAVVAKSVEGRILDDNQGLGIEGNTFSLISLFSHKRFIRVPGFCV